MISTVQVASSAAVLHESAAHTFMALAADAVKRAGQFRVALAGGTTPKAVYALLANDAGLHSYARLGRVHFFWGDERHVPPDHADSNFRMAEEALLRFLPISSHQLWRIKSEYEDAARAAQEYERDLQECFALQAGELPRFDLVLLGLGSDGHTASLFPGTPALHEQSRLVVSNWVAKFNTARITLTVPVLNNAAQVLFLVRGADKAEALRAVLEGPFSPEILPAQLIRPARGQVRWLVDAAAARLLARVDLVELPS